MPCGWRIHGNGLWNCSGKEFSANAFNDYFKWLEGISANERDGHTAAELWRHHRYKDGQESALELAAGILSMETNLRDYEEEAFARRMKKKKKAGRKSRGI